jgi:protein tyrosine/serine phosphatase
MFEPRWVIPGVLVRSARPGRPLGPYTNVPRDDVDKWLAMLQEMGVNSIICLLDDKHLCLYSELPEGLVEYYRNAGFAVAHIMIRDHVLGGTVTDAALEKTWNAFQELPKPVLVHCSAGRDRTGKAVDYLLKKLN